MVIAIFFIEDFFFGILQHFIKHIKYLMGMAASGEHCVLAVRTDDGSGQFGLIICNAIGTPVDSK